jgi:signal transduction histidine kinase
VVDRTRIVVVPPARLQLEAPVLNPLQPGQRIGTLLAVLAPMRIVDTLSVLPPGAGATAVTLRSASGAVLARTAQDADGHHGTRRGGEPMLAAGARVERPDRADGPDLRTTVLEPQRVALAGVAALGRRLFLLGAVVLALGAALGGLAAWRISHPIRRLTATVQEITRRGRPEAIEPLPEGGGEVGVLAASFRAMMQSLTEAQRETLAQSRLALLGEVAVSLAHDVRTPLSVLKTSAHLLSKDDLAAAERRDLAAMVSAEADRLNGVLTNLVDLARPKAVRFETLSLRPLVERATTLFAPMATKAGVAVETVVGPGDVVVRGSGDQLYQALLNLIHNALQAMHGSGVLQVSCHVEPGAVRVEVRDTGPGFGADGLARAFQPFVTTKVDGTGLGMAIVKRIVEEHGGTVGAHDVATGGACVWFRLPLAGARA